jgi:hypothetical protein
MKIAGRQLSTCCAVLAGMLVGAIVVILVLLRPAPIPPDYANLPVLIDYNWDTLTGGGWNYLKRSGTNDAAIATDAKAPVSPANILAIDFSGTKPDTEPTVHYHALPGVREVYVEYWVKFSANWMCDPAGCGKIQFIFPSEGGDLYNGVYCWTERGSCPDDAAKHGQMKTGGQLQFSGGAGSAYPLGEPIFPNVETTPIMRDRWYRMAHYYKWSATPTSCDGIWRWYVDGILQGDRNDICFTIGPGIEVQIAMTRQVTPMPANQFVWFDHFILRGR